MHATFDISTYSPGTTSSILEYLPFFLYLLKTSKNVKIFKWVFIYYLIILFF